MASESFGGHSRESNSFRPTAMIPSLPLIFSLLAVEKFNRNGVSTPGQWQVFQTFTDVTPRRWSGGSLTYFYGVILTFFFFSPSLKRNLFIVDTYRQGRKKVVFFFYTQIFSRPRLQRLVKKFWSFLINHLR